MDKWKPKAGSFCWVIINDMSLKRVYLYCPDEYFYEMGIYFRTRKLAQEALKKIKQVLKSCRHG